MRVEIFHALPLDAKDIRISVFMQEQGFCDEFDALDEIAAHLVMYWESLPVSTCRTWLSDDGWHVGRLAVIQSFRGRGLGQAMLQAAEEYVRSQGGDGISLHAQCRAESFYIKCGYRAFGEIDDEEGVAHIHMKKHFKA